MTDEEFIAEVNRIRTLDDGHEEIGGPGETNEWADVGRMQLLHELFRAQRPWLDLPTEPGAYWHPLVNLSDVWNLTREGEWRKDGYILDLREVPLDLQLLGRYR